MTASEHAAEEIHILVRRTRKAPKNIWVDLLIGMETNKSDKSELHSRVEILLKDF
jgi:hypothetical protein